MTAVHCPSVRFFQISRNFGLKPAGRRKRLWSQIPAVLLCLASAAVAQVSGNFTYTDNGADVTITGYVTAPVGPISIPATIFDSVSGLNDPVVGIGASAFSGCANLTGVTLPPSVKSLGIQAFYQCASLVDVQLPANGVQTISRFAFAGCTALASLTLPGSVTSLGTSAFGGCSALTSVTIPSGVAVGQSAFSGCSGLTNLSISPSVASIGIQAFQYCSGLTTITIPNVGTLQNKVFANCRGLTSVNIPASVTTVSATAFGECSSLTSFTVDAANPNFSSVGGLLTNKEQTRLVTCPGGVSGNFTIPTALTEIGAQAFQNCALLTGVTFHADVARIENQAFSACGKLINAVFLGGPPTFMGTNVFELAAQGFAIYYLQTATGFTSPTWSGYPAFDIGTTTSEFEWLYAYGLPGNSDLLGDANGDGVNLLMAYALNMDPGARNFFPQPVFASDQMSLSFYAGRAGITYLVKTSENLTDWTTTGVTFSDANQIRTATVNFSGPAKFMRLEVSN
jgi:hypothetical protein